jgi:hypothetical protein
MQMRWLGISSWRGRWLMKIHSGPWSMLVLLGLVQVVLP